MRITDYEHATTLNDISIALTHEEVQELALYLSALAARPEVGSVQLSEIDGDHIAREITVAVL